MDRGGLAYARGDPSSNASASRGKGVEWLVNTVTRIDADNSELTLDDGKELSYDYLVIATGPRLAFEEVPGLGPDGFTQSVCSQDHSAQAWTRYQEFLKNPGPIIVGAAPGASCFGPAYETAMILDADLAQTKDPRPCADDLRDERTVHRPHGLRAVSATARDSWSPSFASGTSSGSRTPK